MNGKDNQRLKVGFTDLSWSLKVAVVASWVVGLLYLIGFLTSFIYYMVVG